MQVGRAFLSSTLHAFFFQHLVVEAGSSPQTSPALQTSVLLLALRDIALVPRLFVSPCTGAYHERGGRYNQELPYSCRCNRRAARAAARASRSRSSGVIAGWLRA